VTSLSSEDGFVEVLPGNKPDKTFAGRINPLDDKTYVKLLEKLQASHVELMKLDRTDPNPVVMERLMGDIRIHANRLFIYMNDYIDLQIQLSEEYANAREKLYIEQLALGKSPSAAEKAAVEMTRVQNNAVAISKLRLDQIKNEYNRYDSLAIYLASCLKSAQTERMMR